MDAYTYHLGKIERGIRVVPDTHGNGHIVLLGDLRGNHTTIAVDSNGKYNENGVRVKRGRFHQASGIVADAERNRPVIINSGDRTKDVALVRINTKWITWLDTKGLFKPVLKNIQPVIEPVFNPYTPIRQPRPIVFLKQYRDRLRPVVSQSRSFMRQPGGWTNGLVIMHRGSVVKIYVQDTDMIASRALYQTKSGPKLYEWSEFLKKIRSMKEDELKKELEAHNTD